MTTNQRKRQNSKKNALLNLSMAEPPPQLDECQLCRHATFTNQDWKMILEMEANPPEPTERMKKALRLYQKIIGDQNSIDSSGLQ